MRVRGRRDEGNIIGFGTVPARVPFVPRATASIRPFPALNCSYFGFTDIAGRCEYDRSVRQLMAVSRISSLTLENDEVS